MWKWLRIPKSIALVAFLMPWVTVSCAGQKVAAGSGFAIAFGRLTMGSEGKQSINFLLILALAAIVAGLVFAFRTQSRRNAMLVAITSAGALVLTWIGTSSLNAEALARTAARQNNRGLTSPEEIVRAAAAIQVDWHFGFWLAIIALIVTSIMAFLVYQGRDAEVEAKIREKLRSTDTTK